MAHIEKDVLRKLYEGQLPIDKQIDVLEHISSCEYCAAMFAEVAEEMTLESAPANLKSSILHQANTFPMQNQAAVLPIQLRTKPHMLSKQLQLLLYSMKIGVAAACAILMIFATNIGTMNLKYTPESADFSKITKVTDKFTESVNSWTDQFMNGEVYQND